MKICCIILQGVVMSLSVVLSESGAGRMLNVVLWLRLNFESIDKHNLSPVFSLFPSLSNLYSEQGRLLWRRQHIYGNVKTMANLDGIALTSCFVTKVGDVSIPSTTIDWTCATLRPLQEAEERERASDISREEGDTTTQEHYSSTWGCM